MPLRIAPLVGAAAVLGLLGLFHPLVYPGIPLYRQIAPLAAWWLALHIAQLPLLGLLALGVVLLVEKLEGRAPMVTRAAMGVFAVFYIALNSTVGICTALLVHQSIGLPELRQEIVAQAVQTIWDSRLVGNFSLLWLLAILGWIVGVIAAAVSLRQLAVVPRGAIACMVTGALFFGLSHARPFGPIGLALLVIGVIWLQRRLPR